MPETLKEILKKIPITADPMFLFQMISTFLGATEPETNGDVIGAAQRLLSLIMPATLFWKHYHE